MKQPPPTRTIKQQQMIVAERARMSRLYKGFTQEELALRSQVSYASIRKFERSGEISLKSLLCIADALGEETPFAELFRKADFFKCLDPRLFKRPKRCKDGTFVRSRKMSESELYEYE